MTQHGTNTIQQQCSGCGVPLQTDDAERAGYIPAQALERSPVICQRCFRIKNYNEATPAPLKPDEFLRILGRIGETNCLVVNIVDIFDFEGSMIGSLQRFVGGNPVVLVVNKIDLLPKVTNFNKIVNWVNRQAKENGLKVVEVVLCSAKKNIGFERVLSALDKHRQGKDVYVVGATNVGKSALINRLIRDYSPLNVELTTSKYPGTTLDLVRIPLDDGKFIIDTPGIVYSSRLTELVPKGDLQTIMPEKPIKPIVYQLNEGQTLFFGALARLDFIRGGRQSFTCYVANSVTIHRTKLERADEVYREHKGELLTPPSKESLDKLPPWIKHSVRIPKGGQLDVMISGLGWIKVNGNAGAQLEVHAPKGVKIAVRESFI